MSSSAPPPAPPPHVDTSTLPPLPPRPISDASSISPPEAPSTGRPARSGSAERALGGGYIGAGVLREFLEEYALPVRAGGSTPSMQRSRTMGELSSLGGAFDAEPGAVPGAPTGGHVVSRPTHPTPDKSAKKKKGFFGR